MQQVQIFQWAYGLQCVEMSSMRGEVKRLARKIPYEQTLAAQIAAGKDQNAISQRDGMRKGWIRRSVSPWTRRYWILAKKEVDSKEL